MSGGVAHVGTGPGGVPPAPDLLAAAAAWAARPRVLLALDFDGTLAPLVPDPARARPLPAASAALHRLAASPGLRLALVSGRTVAQLRALADPPPGTVLIGEHGAHADGPPELAWPGPDPAAPARLAGIAEALELIAAAHPGCWVEHKATSAVLHTRRAERPEAATATAAALAGPARAAGAHPLVGKEVVEISVTRATKGAALARLREHLALPPEAGGVAYVGDDVTDERAFAVLADDRGDLTVKVGEGDTVARHRVDDPWAVAQLLDHLVAVRSPAAPPA